MAPDVSLSLGQLPSRGATGTLTPSTPLTPLTPGVPRSNPLSSKVTTVLSTSYADAEFREALALLDERGVQNTPETRRLLRLDLQKEVIDVNSEIINDFGRVAEQLKKIGSAIEKLNETYSAMRSELDVAHAATQPMLAEGNSLMTQRREVEGKQQLLSAFRDHYVLSEDDIATLTLTSEPVDDAFFAALTKAKDVARDCELLLGFESQTLGLELVEATTKHLNAAFQKLYRWIQREFRGINLEQPQMGARIRRALRVLAERPSLFQSCLDAFAGAREAVLSDAFFTALTGSSAAGVADPSVSKPIEIVAHDPLRYVGDMLAWTHSAAVSEREALESLFVADGEELSRGMKAGREQEVWRLAETRDGSAADDDGEGEFDPIEALNNLVDRNVSGTARLLRQRIEQVIQTNEDTILAYKLANLLNFYRVTFAKLLVGRGRPPSSPANRLRSVLIESLQGLEQEALRQFRSLMRDHIAALQGEFQQPPADLSPPEFLQDALTQLSAILKTYDTSLTAAADREADFQPVLAEAFDPFMRGCETMAKNLEQPDRSVFHINCVSAAQRTLAPFDFVEARIDVLSEAAAADARELAASQYMHLRLRSGLDQLLRTTEGLDARKESDLKAFSDQVTRRDLAAASATLDAFLPSALMDATENLRHLQDARLAREVTEQATRKFCADFEALETLLVKLDEEAEKDAGEAGEDEPNRLRNVFPRTTVEINVLLS